LSNLDQYSRKAGGATKVRGVPPLLALGLVVGNIPATIGWLVFGFGMIFWWLLGMQADVRSLIDFRGELLQATGRVTQVMETNYSEGGGEDSPGTPIFRVAFDYETSAGQVRQDACYTVGAQYNLGQDVPVEYLPAPKVAARILGTRRSPLGWGTLFVGLVPLAALVFLAGSVLAGLRTLAVLRRGRLVRGRLVDKQATSTTINDRRVFALTFEFEDEHGNMQQAKIRTHRIDKLEDEPEERLFYDPQHPERARMVDLLPGNIRVLADGSLQADSSLGMWIRAVLIPAIVLGSHGMVALNWFR